MPRIYENNAPKLVEDYSKIENSFCRDANCQPYERGVLSTLLTLSPKFSVSISGIAKIMNVTENAIRKSFQRLTEQGYMRICEGRTGDGKFAKTRFYWCRKPVFKDENFPVPEDIDFNDTGKLNRKNSAKMQSKIVKTTSKIFSELTAKNSEKTLETGENQTSYTAEPCAKIPHTVTPYSANPYTAKSHTESTHTSKRPPINNQIIKNQNINNFSDKSLYQSTANADFSGVEGVIEHTKKTRFFF